MRNLLVMSLIMLGLIACSSDKTPTPEKVSYNLQAVPDDKVVAVILEKTHKAPEAGQIVDETVIWGSTPNNGIRLSHICLTISSPTFPGFKRSSYVTSSWSDSLSEFKHRFHC